MTDEEAIKILETEKGLCCGKKKYEAIDCSISALRERIARQNPKLLTLDELRGMGGEPVWVIDISKWAIVEVDSNGGWAGVPFVNGGSFNWNVEARGLKCCRTKPELPEK